MRDYMNKSNYGNKVCIQNWMQSSWLGRMVAWEAEELSKQSPLCGVPSHRKSSCPPSIPCLAMGSNYSCNMSLPSKIITNSSSVSEIFTWKVTPWLYILTSVNYLLWITRFCIKVKWLFTTLRTQWQENWNGFLEICEELYEWIQLEMSKINVR